MSKIYKYNDIEYEYFGYSKINFDFENFNYKSLGFFLDEECEIKAKTGMIDEILNNIYYNLTANSLFYDEHWRKKLLINYENEFNLLWKFFLENGTKSVIKSGYLFLTHEKIRGTYVLKQKESV